ncbi:amidase [Nocardia sp. NPDC127526]|uniref:amidase n=1 Tax=Nocardia sp. NPDC127526 TaxID=3345393 RepID=UPI00363230AC
MNSNRATKPYSIAADSRGSLTVQDYGRMDMTELRAAIRSGAVTADAVVSVARQALEQVNQHLDALAMPPFESALESNADGPLAGVPLVIKDTGPFAREVPFTAGTRVRFDPPGVDHDLMSRFRAAGLVTLGQSTMPEMGFSMATENPWNGPTRNPWMLDRGVGGSSGGAAALVAAGAVPVAHGSDGAGSVRIPASCCGVVGLKPSRGRTPNGPLSGEPAFGLLAESALTRTVRDTAHILDAIAAPPSGDKFALPRPVRPYAQTMSIPPGRLKVAISTDAWSGVPVDPQVVAVTLEVGRCLEELGHVMESDRPTVDSDSIIEAGTLAMIAGGAELRTFITENPTKLPDRGLRILQAMSQQILTETERSTAMNIAAALHAQDQVTRPIGLFLDRYDLLVTPTFGQLPLPHGVLDYDSPGYTMRTWLERLFEMGPFTAAFNISGHPAISLPVGQSREGLPIGVQLVADRGREDLLLQVAAQLEEAMPWRDRRPLIYAG